MIEVDWKQENVVVVNIIQKILENETLFKASNASEKFSKTTTFGFTQAMTYFTGASVMSMSCSLAVYQNGPLLPPMPMFYQSNDCSCWHTGQTCDCIKRDLVDLSMRPFLKPPSLPPLSSFLFSLLKERNPSSVVSVVSAPGTTRPWSSTCGLTTGQRLTSARCAWSSATAWSPCRDT